MKGKNSMYDSIQFAENIGERLRKTSKISIAKNLNPQLKSFIKAIGGKLEQEEGFAGLTILDDDRFSISLDLFTSPLRDNFYITKALGDYLLFGNSDKKKYGSFRIDDTTFLSNSFAYGFLTPKKEILKRFKDVNGNITLCASYFQIPTDFIKARLKYLNKLAQENKFNNMDEFYNKLIQQKGNIK